MQSCVAGQEEFRQMEAGQTVHKTGCKAQFLFTMRPGNPGQAVSEFFLSFELSKAVPQKNFNALLIQL